MPSHPKPSHPIPSCCTSDVWQLYHIFHVSNVPRLHLSCSLPVWLNTLIYLHTSRQRGSSEDTGSVGDFGHASLPVPIWTGGFQKEFHDNTITEKGIRGHAGAIYYQTAPPKLSQSMWSVCENLGISWYSPEISKSLSQSYCPEFPALGLWERDVFHLWRYQSVRHPVWSDEVSLPQRLCSGWAQSPLDDPISLQFTVRI